jgi:hypothetical protein
MIAALLGVALASEGACGGELSAPPDLQAVAWISPLRRTVGGSRSLRVVPTSALRSAAASGPLTTGRVLQLLGLRSKSDTPRRSWKVTVFEASSGALCRPVDVDAVDAAGSTWAGDFLAGLPVCPGGPGPDDTGCGTTVDRADGGPGVEVFHARWRDLAPQGFCVMPLDRFVAEL